MTRWQCSALGGAWRLPFLAQTRQDVVFRHRPAEQKTLHEVDAGGRQESLLLGLLDALGNDLEAQ